MLSLLLLSAQLTAPPTAAAPAAGSHKLPTQTRLGMRASAPLASSHARGDTPGRGKIIGGSILLGVGGCLAVAGTAGTIHAVREPIVGWLIIPSLPALIAGLIVTPLGAVRLSQGLGERKAYLKGYVFAPGREALGLGVRARF